jgi:hypothetical protein
VRALPGGVVSLAGRWGWLKRPIVLAPRQLPPGEPAPRTPAEAVTAGGPAAPVLEVDGLSGRFGGLTAVADVSFSIAPGETIGIIGANGAGKTTPFNAITGFAPPSVGRRHKEALLYDEIVAILVSYRRLYGLATLGFPPHTATSTRRRRC